MTPLRQRMVQELELQRKSKHTTKAYLLAVKQLAEHFGKAPDDISLDEVRQFFHHLIVKRKLAATSVNVKLSGIQFLYRRVLKRPKFDIGIDRKRSGKLPTPLSRSEIKRLFDVTVNPKHRVMLMTGYGGGLRVSEVVSLRVDDICSDRMLLRVQQGKGRKDRYTLLSQSLLQELRQVLAIVAAESLAIPKSPQRSAEHQLAANRLQPGERKGQTHSRQRNPLPETFSRHALARRRSWLGGDRTVAWPSAHLDNHQISPRDQSSCPGYSQSVGLVEGA